MSTDGKARTAAATAKRTRTKHDRWIAELAAAGWSVIQAGPVVVRSVTVDGASLAIYCTRCDRPLLDEYDTYVVDLPLPRVLHAVSGHTCEERS